MGSVKLKFIRCTQKGLMQLTKSSLLYSGVKHPVPPRGLVLLRYPVIPNLGRNPEGSGVSKYTWEPADWPSPSEFQSGPSNFGFQIFISPRRDRTFNTCEVGLRTSQRLQEIFWLNFANFYYHQIDVLQAEVTALKTLVITSTPSMPSSTQATANLEPPKVRLISQKNSWIGYKAAVARPLF